MAAGSGRSGGGGDRLVFLKLFLREEPESQGI